MKMLCERLKLWTTRPSAQRLARPLSIAWARYCPRRPDAAFPLQQRHAERYAAPPRAAGVCAHVVHPLAGQGVNLGVRDVMALVPALRAGLRQGTLGDPDQFAAYERHRRRDNALMLRARTTLREALRLRPVRRHGSASRAWASLIINRRCDGASWRRPWGLAPKPASGQPQESPHEQRFETHPLAAAHEAAGATRPLLWLGDAPSLWRAA